MLFGINYEQKNLILSAVFHSITEFKAKRLKQTAFVYFAQSDPCRAQSTLIIMCATEFQGIKSVRSRRCWCLEREKMEMFPRRLTKHQIWSSSIVLWWMNCKLYIFIHHNTRNALAGVQRRFSFWLNLSSLCVFQTYCPLIFYIVVCYLEMRVSAIIFTRLRSDIIM